MYLSRVHVFSVEEDGRLFVGHDEFSGMIDFALEARQNLS